MKFLAAFSVGWQCAMILAGHDGAPMALRVAIIVGGTLIYAQEALRA